MFSVIQGHDGELRRTKILTKSKEWRSTAVQNFSRRRKNKVECLFSSYHEYVGGIPLSPNILMLLLFLNSGEFEFSSPKARPNRTEFF
jgi:hypothetical protein